MAANNLCGDDFGMLMCLAMVICHCQRKGLVDKFSVGVALLGPENKIWSMSVAL